VVILEMGHINYLLGLALNPHSPNLSLPRHLGLQVWATGTWPKTRICKHEFQ
jgi:hypothetical protein